LNADSSNGDDPLALNKAWRRRLFAQEFTTQLRRVGSASLGEMEDQWGLKLFKIEASNEELRQVAEAARRFGWVSAPEEPGDGEWSLTESGLALPRPTSLATLQIASRILRAVNPVREQATNFLPYLALVAGGIGVLGANVTALTAGRGIAIAVLVWTFAIQLAGEAQIIRAIKSWPKLDKEREQRGRHQAVLRFYGWFRFGLNVAFLIGVVAAFGFGLFNQRGLFLIAGAAALALGASVLVLSLRATLEVAGPVRRGSAADVRG
jgi:hypothetical protein